MASEIDEIDIEVDLQLVQQPDDARGARRHVDSRLCRATIGDGSTRRRSPG
jgi:hypothetical protein